LRIKTLLGIMALAFLTLFACGKKGPPSLPQEAPSLRVEGLRASWQQGRVVLDGRAVGARGRDIKTTVTGARIYFASYPLEDAPCEGCPITYKDFKEVGAGVITAERFHCEVPGVEKEGLYFLKVHLLGKGGEPGPPSNRVQSRVPGPS